MKKQTVDPNRRCPKCGKAENQINAGSNRSGTQRFDKGAFRLQGIYCFVPLVFLADDFFDGIYYPLLLTPIKG